ncbi:MAG TPA: hypothetical protein VGF96_10260 [Terracidiphilus sp.]
MNLCCAPVAHSFGAGCCAPGNISGRPAADINRPVAGVKVKAPGGEILMLTAAPALEQRTYDNSVTRIPLHPQPPAVRRT